MQSRTLLTGTVFLLPLLTAVQSSAPSARERVDAAVSAMGGTDALRALDPVQVESIGHGYALEQSFTWNGKCLTLFLNAHTSLPTMLEILRSDDTFDIWGDVIERRWYSLWSFERGSVWYPRQTTVDWNGWPFSDDTVLSLRASARLSA